MGKLKRYYYDGVFISTALPEIAIRLPASFDYLGSTSFILVEAAQVDRHHFLDANPDRNVRSLVILHFESFLPAINQTFNYRIPEPEDQAGPDFRYSPSKVQLGEHEYIHNTWIFDALKNIKANPDKELVRTAGLLEVHDYTLPEELQMSRYVRVVGEDRKSELILFYLEPLAPTGLHVRDFVEGGRGEKVIDRISSELTARSHDVFFVESG